MTRVPGSLLSNSDMQAVIEHAKATQRALNGRIEFGHPGSPLGSDLSLATGLGTSHNGTVVNIYGSWVDQTVTAKDTAVLFRHNLDRNIVTAAGLNLPNVRWLLFGVVHGGSGVSTGVETISCNYDRRDQGAITRNALPLRFYAAAGRNVTPGTPLKVTVFFTPAVYF